MRDDIRAFVDPIPSEEDIRSQERATYFKYMLLAASVCLVVGAAIGRFALGARPPGVALTLEPPPGWGLPCASVPGATATPRSTATPAPLSIYISGAVRQPQVVLLPPGSLLADALTAAGGPASNADLDSVNLALALKDHDHILIPTQPAASPAPTMASETPVHGGIININTATIEELQTLPGIGATRAQDIVNYRLEHGPFQTIEEIRNVSGIGPVTFDKLAPYITVDP